MRCQSDRSTLIEWAFKLEFAGREAWVLGNGTEAKAAMQSIRAPCNHQRHAGDALATNISAVPSPLDSQSGSGNNNQEGHRQPIHNVNYHRVNYRR